MEYTKTELHTHLVGILSVNELVLFAKKCGINEVMLFDEKEIPVENILTDDYIDLFRIKRNNRVDYKMLDTIYNYRSLLIKYIAKKYAIDNNITNNQANKIVYNLLINFSLRSLIEQGVKYVEISYSFSDRIKNFHIDEDIKDKIKCKFLLSTQRTNPIKSYTDDSRTNTFLKSSKDLLEVLKNGNAVGFDIMGEETKLSLEEKDYSNEYDSFERKLEILFNSLLKYNNTTLRIHSGETSNSFNNTLDILKMIDRISERNKYIIPPPEIRIGHGLYFDKNRIYLELLKKYGCIIELNASSNFALSNIKNYNSLPYKYYIKNGVPIVISTDGHGMYSTNIIREDMIAYSVTNSDIYNKITDIDQDIYKKKGL